MTNFSGPPPEVSTAFLIDQLQNLSTKDHELTAARIAAATPDFGSYVAAPAPEKPYDNVIQLDAVRERARILLGGAAMTPIDPESFAIGD
jgi:hypothetical protein